jgi:hypothetical protein
MRSRLLGFCLLVALLAISARSAHASKDIVQFGSTIHVSRGSAIHDAVCFFCNVDDDGTVEGDIVVFFGNVHVAEHANHDVVTFFGNIKADNNAAIGQDMVAMFSNVHLGEDVTIGKDLVAMFGRLDAPNNVNVGGDQVVQPPWLFWGPLMIFALVLVLIIREFRNYRRRAYIRNYPFPPRP